MTGLRQRQPVRVVQHVGMVHTRVFKMSSAERRGKRLHRAEIYFWTGQPEAEELRTKPLRPIRRGFPSQPLHYKLTAFPTFVYMMRK